MYYPPALSQEERIESLAEKATREANKTEELVRIMAKALAEVCLHSYIMDLWILANVDPADVDAGELVDGEVWQAQPWYEMAKALPVSREALIAIAHGSSPPDWDKDVTALTEYIAASVMEMGKATN